MRPRQTRDIAAHEGIRDLAGCVDGTDSDGGGVPDGCDPAELISVRPSLPRSQADRYIDLAAFSASGLSWVEIELLAGGTRFNTCAEWVDSRGPDDRRAVAVTVLPILSESATSREWIGRGQRVGGPLQLTS